MVNKKKSGGLAKRYQASYENKGSSGSRARVMNYKALDRDDIEFFTPKEGRNRINIIPYIIKTKNHPLVKKGEFEIGDKDYVMDVFVHRGVGPSEASVVCLKETYGKACPICEQMVLLRKQGKEKEAGTLKPSRRVFYNVQDLKEPEKLKIFETSHYLFEQELIEEARDDDEGGFIDFADEEKGKEIKFRCSKVSKGGLEFNEFKSFSFEERDDNIPDELIESAISFDEILTVPTYEEAEKILYGQDDDEDESEKKSSKKSKSDDEDEDEEKPVKKSSKKSKSDEDDEDEDEEKPVKKSSKKSKSDEDDEDDEDEEKPVKKSSKKSKSDEDDEDDDEDEEKPVKKSSKKSKSDEDDEDDDEDEEKPVKKSKSKLEPEFDEDDDEEKPVKKSSKKSKSDDKTKCPFGHNFADDCDVFEDDCDNCDLWAKCMKAY